MYTTLKILKSKPALSPPYSIRLYTYIKSLYKFCTMNSRIFPEIWKISQKLLRYRKTTGLTIPSSILGLYRCYKNL